MKTMIGSPCSHYDCSNRNSFGYCRTTACINEHYRQEQWNLPSVLPKAQWMPYPTNEPTKGKRYLVTVRHNGNLIVDIDDYFVYGWDDWHDAVIAWAELPEPYVDDAPTVIEEEVYGQYTDTAGNYHWCGTQNGEHTIKMEVREI